MDAKTQLSKLGIELETGSFEAKLRAIAKHAEELANELDAIDAIDTLAEKIMSTKTEEA